MRQGKRLFVQFKTSNDAKQSRSEMGARVGDRGLSASREAFGFNGCMLDSSDAAAAHRAALDFQTSLQGDNLILRFFNGLPVMSVRRMEPCQLLDSLMTLNTMTLTPFFKATLPLSASISSGRASVKA